MMMLDVDGIAWYKSSKSSGRDNCVEVAYVDGEFRLRDSKNRNGGMLRFTPAEFEAFAHGIRAGEFDLLRWIPASSGR